MNNTQMIQRLKKKNYIESEDVEKAFREVDRKRFVPGKFQDIAYKDRPLPIGRGQTISAPSMVAINTELLEPEEDNQVLEIGSGCGYQAAILGVLAEKVTGVEIEDELASTSRKNLEAVNIENVEVVEGVGLEAVERKFNRILYSCAIDTEEFERAKDYLEERGKMVAPVSVKDYQVIKSYQDGETSEHMRVRFVEYRD